MISDHTLDRAGDPGFWLALNPDLHISNNPFTIDEPYPATPAEIELAVRQITKEGYFQMRPLVPRQETQRLARCVLKVAGEGFPAPFAMVYDEFWSVLGRLSPVLSPVLGDRYQILADFWMFLVDHNTDDSGWLPHRDHEFFRDVFRADGRPTVITVWMPFTDASPLNSCLYVLPTHLDPNCPNTLSETKLEPKVLPSVRALPIQAGGIIGFDQYLLHWGSRSSEWAAEPRISIGMYFQSGDIAPYVDNLTVDIPSPVSFDYRLAVIARKILQYSNFSAISNRLVFPDNLIKFCVGKFNHLIPPAVIT